MTSKEEFLTHGIRRARQRRRSENNNTSADERNADIGTSVRRANVSDDKSDETISTTTTGNVQQREAVNGSIRDDTIGLHELNSSSNEPNRATSYEYAKIGRNYGSTDQPVQRPEPTVKKRTRKTYIDKLVDKMIPNKTPDKAIKERTIKEGARKVLTVLEVNKNKHEVIEMIKWTSDHLDITIAAITKGHREVEIWGDLNYVDMEILAEAWMDAGQKSPWVANQIRKALELHRKMKVGVILAPRLYKTFVTIMVRGMSISLV